MMIASIVFLTVLSAIFGVCIAEHGVNHDMRVTAILTNITDSAGAQVWKWPISEDESRRLTVMLGREFNDLHIGGTYVTTPIAQCSTCGKDHEFIDWVYTALEKGFHTPEFVYEALRDRRSPKETKHDIYCSKCGQLTSLRRRKGTPPEVPKVNKKLLREQSSKKNAEDSGLVLGYEVEKDNSIL